ncbi:calcium/sodium antiporter [Citreimonas salinaria]|uniref:Cation:H+ antiporter n=1 Tax=Citreimonas salinaria TaxID=321339 RepID=A0A1H3H7R1_9RHOB|nr:calcium/sodium antiporter [Citreimonas salinaria]SDY10814.1 cation:H+ antiporter [Citreimonas salinaria]
MWDVWLPLAGGLVLLVLGGELLVRGAVNVATALRVSPLVIGLTLVGFGTSTPELVTSVRAALADSPGIAYGNIVGSNIANILLIGGLAALLFPIAVARAALRRDGAVMLAVAVGFSIVAALMPLGRVVGSGFLLALVAYIVFTFMIERRNAPPAPADGAKPATGIGLSVLIAIGGLACVIVGGGFLVDGAVSLARGFGISETVIGLTIVAVGTSMPEMVTSVVAALKRQSDVAFGNIIGSNIYNILGIGGATALIAPGAVPAEIVSFDNLVMIAVSLVIVGFAWTGMKIVRWEGAALLAGYVAYVYVIWP